MQNRSCSEHTLATDCIDLLLSRLGEKPGLDDDRNLRADTLTEKLGVARVAEINDGHLAILALDGTGLLGDERPDPVHVDHRAVELVLGLVEVPHTDLTEVTRVVFVPVDPVVVLTTSVTATARILAVLADTAVSSAHVAALLAVLLQVRGLQQSYVIVTFT